MPDVKYAGHTLFGRKYRVIIGTAQATGLEVSKLRCVFQIEKSMSETPNQSVIKVYNLSEKSRNSIPKEGGRVIVEAGYMDNPQYGLIFDGDVVQSYHYKEEKVDWVTELVSQDGDVFFNSGIISVSYGAGETTASQLEGLAKNSKDPNIQVGNVSDSLSRTKLARGKAMFGQAADIAHKLAKTEGGLFYVNDRKICLSKPMDLPKGEIISLTPKSGLVGAPEVTENGIKVKCLLHPLINLETLVHVDHTYVRQTDGLKLQGAGVYKVIALTHTGDNRGEDWYTDFEGIAQPGATPLTGKNY